MDQNQTMCKISFLFISSYEIMSILGFWPSFNPHTSIYSGVARILVRGNTFSGSASREFQGRIPRGPDNFRKISKNFLRKLLKCTILAYFSKNLANHALIVRAFWRKTQMFVKIWENLENFWWKFNGKNGFFTIFGKFVTKNIAFGNNIIFLQQFFPFRGIFLPFPLAMPLCLCMYILNIISKFNSDSTF